MFDSSRKHVGALLSFWQKELPELPMRIDHDPGTGVYLLVVSGYWETSAYFIDGGRWCYTVQTEHLQPISHKTVIAARDYPSAVRLMQAGISAEARAVWDDYNSDSPTVGLEAWRIANAILKKMYVQPGEEA